MMDFKSQYLHPLWQKKRLEVMEAAEFECEMCGDTEQQLNVHHKRYVKGNSIWDYPNNELQCLCGDCHSKNHSVENSIRSLLADIDYDSKCYVLGILHCVWTVVNHENMEMPTDPHGGVSFNYLEGISDYLYSQSSPLRPESIYELFQTKAGIIDHKFMRSLVKGISGLRGSMCDLIGVDDIPDLIVKLSEVCHGKN